MPGTQLCVTSWQLIALPRRAAWPARRIAARTGLGQQVPRACLPACLPGSCSKGAGSQISVFSMAVGQPFERPKLLALREQLLHVAQEVLQQDMVGTRPQRQRRRLPEGASDPRMPPAPPIVPEATGVTGELPREIVSSEEHSTARSSRTSSARRRPSRPGSSRQPAASGNAPPADAVDLGDLAMVDVKLQAGMLRSATPEGELAPEEAENFSRLPSLRAASRHAGGSATPDGWTHLPQPPATAR
ncbi:unnamed protein product [Prorocentrum cordatum]|uniref:Uncharacterized protein n=1 Tax=Prorocentrum cordatum TaxID=2364126 RepID=A0ABN9PP29_9DINO|nr:unnamed protein product [Polarella glacialis]